MLFSSSLAMPHFNIFIFVARNTSALLGKLTIPACIVIGLVWIVFLGIEIYTAVGAPGIMVPFWKNLLNGVSNDRFTFVFLQYAEAAVFYLCIVAVMFVLAFGAISVFLALQGTSATHRQSIINIVVLSVALFLVIGGFGLFRCRSSVLLVFFFFCLNINFS